MRISIMMIGAALVAFSAAADPELVPDEVRVELNKLCDGKNSAANLDTADILATLLKLYRMEFSGSEMSKTLTENMLTRVQSCTAWDHKQCARPAGLNAKKPILVKHPKADLQTRRALISLIESAMNGQSIENGQLTFTGPTRSTYDRAALAIDSDYWREQSLEALSAGTGSLGVTCNAGSVPPAGTTQQANSNAPKDVMDGVDLIVVGGASFVDRITLGSIRGKKAGASATYETPFSLMDISKPFEGSLILAKDSDQFFSSSPKAAEVGLSIEGNQTSNLDFDMALGYSLARSDPQIEKSKIIGCSNPSAYCDAGNKRAYTAFVAYSQKATEETVFDNDVPPLVTGDPQTTTRDFAYGTFKAGLRADYEFIGYIDRDTLQRNIGSKSALSVEYLTDNFREFEAGKVAATWHPPAWFGIDSAGYRRDLDFSVVDDRVTMKWDINSVLDYINYAEAPPDFKTPDQTDKVDVSDYARAGFDFKIDTTLRLPFTLRDQQNQLIFSYKHKYRKPLDGSDTDAGLNIYSISAKNFLTFMDSVSIEYEDGIHPDTLAPRDNWTIKASLKAKIQP